MRVLLNVAIASPLHESSRLTTAAARLISRWSKSPSSCTPQPTSGNQQQRWRSATSTAKCSIRHVSNNNDDDERIRATRKWLDSIVIGQKLCPFAPPVRSAPQLRIRASTATDEDSLVKEVAAEARILVGDKDENQFEVEETMNNRPRPETTLLVLNENVYPEISSFRHFVQVSWRLQAESIHDNGFASDLQIVLFHPHAKHDTYAEQDDCADFTIRSPHATVHLLREVDVMKAVRGGYTDLEGLPSRNKAKMRKDGLEACLNRLEECRATGTSE